MADVTSIKPDPIQMDVDDLRHYESVLVTDITDARSDMSATVADVQRWRRYMQSRQVVSNPRWPGASELLSPFAKQSVIAMLAEVAPALLNVDPIARFSHLGGRDEGDASELWEPFYEAMYRRKTRFRHTMRDAIQRSFIDGIAIVQTGWETRQGWRHGWDTQLGNVVDPMTGHARRGVTSIKAARGVQTVYDLPRYDLIAIENFAVFPAANADIQESAGVAARYEVSAHTVLEGIRMKRYDKQAGMAVLAWYESQIQTLSPDDVARRISGTNPETEPVRQSITLTECYFRMPGRSALEPPEDWLFTLHEGSATIIQARPSPWWHGKRPFAICRPYPDSSGIFGDGIISYGAGHIQDAKTTFLRLLEDQTEYNVNPRVLVAASMYNKAREAFNKNNKPGGLIAMPDQMFAQRGSVLQPFSTGASATNIIPLLQEINVESQRVFPDSASGAQMIGNTTATEAQKVAEGANKLIAQVVEHCADFVAEVLQQTHGLVLQFMGKESVQQLWQEVNGEQNVPIEQAAMGEYFIDANGISETNSLTVKANQAMIVGDVLGTEPAVMGDPLRRHALRQFQLQRAGINARDYDQIMGTAEDWQKADAAMQQQGGGPQAADTAVKMKQLELQEEEMHFANMRKAAELQTKRISDRERIQAELFKLGLTTVMPDEQAPDVTALSREGKPEGEQAPANGAQPALVSPATPVDNAAMPSTSPVEAQPAMGGPMMPMGEQGGLE